MDLISIDVTDLPAGAVRRGDFATLLGDGIGVDDLAEPGRVRSSVTSLGYRLTLPRGIKPGDLSVPLTLNLQL